MNAPHRAVPADSLTDAALSLVWPGLGQLHQGRTTAGIYFIAESLTLVAAFVWAPGWRVLAAVTFAAIAIWAIADAATAARRPAGSSERAAR